MEKFVENMMEYVENLKKYNKENMKEYDGTCDGKKEYEETRRKYKAIAPLTIYTLGLWKILRSFPLYRLWDLEKFWAFPSLYLASGTLKNWAYCDRKWGNVPYNWKQKFCNDVLEILDSEMFVYLKENF